MKKKKGVPWLMHFAKREWSPVVRGWRDLTSSWQDADQLQDLARV